MGGANRRVGQCLSLFLLLLRDSVKEELREEVVYDGLSAVPQHIVRNLPPFTNVSLRLVLSNPEGRKESEELLVLTDEDGTSHRHHRWRKCCCFLNAASSHSSWRCPCGFHPGQQLRAADQSELEGTSADLRTHPHLRGELTGDAAEEVAHGGRAQIVGRSGDCVTHNPPLVTVSSLDLLQSPELLRHRV